MENSNTGAPRDFGALLDGIERFLEILCRLGTMIGALLVIATMIVVGYSVVLRYAFGVPQVWTDELVSFWLVAIVTLGAADVLRRDEHIRIDLVTDRLPTGAKAWIEIAGLVSVILFSTVLTISGWEMVKFSWDVELLSEGYLELPMWIPQSLIPVGFALMGVAALYRLVYRFRACRAEDEA